MSLLQVLPDILLFQLFNSWIDRKCLTNFDSALCSKEKRPCFLTILAIHTLIFLPQIEAGICDEQWIPWALKRGICLQKLTFDFSVWSKISSMLAAGNVHLYGTEEVDFLDSFNKDSLTEINRENQLNQILNMCPKLSRLSIVCSRALNLSSFFQRDEITPILQRLTSLMLLCVSLHCDLYGNVDIGMLTQLANKCTNLRSLALDCSHSQTSDLHLLLVNCEQMRVIVLYDVKLTKKLVSAVMVRRETLQKLVILPQPSTKITIDICLPLLSGLLHAEHIEIDCKNEDVTHANHSIKMQRQARGQITWTSHLELIRLHNITAFKCFQLCPQIVRLTQIHKKYISQPFDQLADLIPAMKYLQRLDWHKCEQDSSFWIWMMIKHCPSLRHLSFDECVGLQFTYKQYCKLNRSLQWLTISHCPLINRLTAKQLLEWHPSLTSVKCKHCPQTVRGNFETVTMTKTVTDNSVEFRTTYSDKGLV
jgi:hypothetical protein